MAGARKVAARLSIVVSRVGTELRRLFRKSCQGITILVVEDSARPPKGITIPYFGITFGFIGLVCVLGLTVLLSIRAAAGGTSIEKSGGDLIQARRELDQFKDKAEDLAKAYSALSGSLAEIAVALEKPKAKAGLDPIRRAIEASAAGSRAPRLQGEAKRIAEASAGLEASIASIEEMGKASASMNAIKTIVPALWPIKNSLGHLSATFGPNPNPFTGEPYFHTGIDCSTYREGDPIVATANGTVVFAGMYYGYGLSVLISHPNGYFTRYGHMQRLIVRRGQAVKQGQAIGILGNTGNSTGPHTHYEVIIGNKLVDPIDYLWAAEDRKAPEGTTPFGQE
jgi:murein DD-endopeptidase MepM/ murein hydrolase activator NlpD